MLINSLSITKSCDLILKYIDNKDLQQKHINESKKFILKNFQLSSFNNNLKELITDIVK